MFTGIVEDAATVIEFRVTDGGARLTVESALDHSGTVLGDSIAVDGVCLTVAALEGSRLSFDLVPETLRATSLSKLKAGQRVNLERSLRLGQKVSGHFVFGHVDGCVTLIEADRRGESLRLVWELPEEYAPYIVRKGSVALNGVSLTVGAVEEGTFEVFIVPHTAEVTNLSSLRSGDAVNLEVDMLARYARNILQSDLTTEPKADISLEFLKECGFIP